ncbi:hypothetical protein PWG71_23575 [Nocardiopsis sp. N85]|uniref:hypothetical protein n=1 Tax=Nocardiopsis sp. N85 TaxID=3029400 RepID=UPI00237F0087|nr:hypothetical protein [Nocardiopsis sp. N85]MDE3724383.1 hypothetical protein [Nocardiopsis sp. N85]
MSENPLTSGSRWLLAGLILILPITVLVIRVTHWGMLDQTALFYLGLPTAIALLVVFTARPKSGTGVSMAALTVVLAMAALLLGEGMVCLIIAAPLLYGMIAIVSGIASLIARGGRGSQQALFAVPLLFVLTLEGVAGITFLPRADQGEGSVFVDAAPVDVASALAAPPAYGPFEAPFLRAVPFPEPVAATGTGLAVGDTRAVEFTPRTTFQIGSEPTPRHLDLEIVESEVRADGGRVVFEVAEDATFARWMDMHRATATWTAEADGTRMTWTIDYDRTYEPSWYFGPIQAYATDLAAGYLADTFADEALR